MHACSSISLPALENCLTMCVFCIEQTLRRYLVDEADDKMPQETRAPIEWRIEVVATAPRQRNGFDCGVFCCMFAFYLSVGRVPSFTQDDMLTFRRRILLDIHRLRVD